MKYCQYKKYFKFCGEKIPVYIINFQLRQTKNQQISHHLQRKVDAKIDVNVTLNRSVMHLQFPATFLNGYTMVTTSSTGNKQTNKSQEVPVKTKLTHMTTWFYDFELFSPQHRSSPPAIYPFRRLSVIVLRLVSIIWSWW